MSTYKLTLHKKSYLLTGIKKDDSNKEKVKQLGAKWNGSLGGWLFFPDKHKEGLKFAKEIGAEIDEKIKEEKSPKKESKEKVEKKKCECCEKYKSEIDKLKQELVKLQDKCDRMEDVLGENGLGISDDESEDKQIKNEQNGISDDENGISDDENEESKEITQFSKTKFVEELQVLYDKGYVIVYNDKNALHFLRHKDKMKKSDTIIEFDNVVNYEKYYKSLSKDQKHLAIKFDILLATLSDKPAKLIFNDKKYRLSIIPNLPKWGFDMHSDGDNITLEKVD